MAGLGWTFRFPGRHLYIVVSDPSVHEKNHCLCVNLTGAENYHGDEFFLDVGDHPFIRKRSVLYFPDPLLTSGALIDSYLNRSYFDPNRAERHEDINETLLKKIINKCRQTTHLPKKYRHFLHPPQPPKDARIQDEAEQ